MVGSIGPDRRGVLGIPGMLFVVCSPRRGDPFVVSRFVFGREVKFRNFDRCLSRFSSKEPGKWVRLQRKIRGTHGLEPMLARARQIERMTEMNDVLFFLLSFSFLFSSGPLDACRGLLGVRVGFLFLCFFLVLSFPLLLNS